MSLFKPMDAARYAILIADVLDLYQRYPDQPTPPIDAQSPYPNSALAQWKVEAYLVANDIVFNRDKSFTLNQRNVFYGTLSSRAGSAGLEYLIAIRGTAGLAEWLIDADAGRVSYPAGGEVEAGFYGVYTSLQCVEAGWKDTNGGHQPITPACKTLRERVPRDADITVTGHSLGSAIATYLLLDLAQAGFPHLKGCLFASPRPGDGAFAALFEKMVRPGQYRVYDYDRDLVPNLPPTLAGYSSLKQVQAITARSAQADIADDPGSNHHALCYAAMLWFKAEPDLAAWRQLLKYNDSPESSILAGKTGFLAWLGRLLPG